jgi:glycosyltransferase involved in cell wall biosynthesis
MVRRILHVIGGMDRGGIETWLMHVLRNIDHARYKMDFLISATQPYAYDDEVIALGSRLLRGPHVRKSIAFGQHFKQLMQSAGPYHVVHSHLHFHSGLVLKLARECGIPVRVAHSHTSPPPPAKHDIIRRLYRIQAQRWIWRYATHGLGISETAVANLYGPGWQSDARFQVLLYGFDFSRFLHISDADTCKAALNIPSHRKVIGHVGRFVPLKNHQFLVDIFHKVLGSGIDAHLLMLGDGPLLCAIREYVQRLGLSDRCTIPGSQADTVPYFGAMDTFVFPSQYEGLGIVALEAQVVGVPVIASSSIPREVGVIPELVGRLDLKRGVDVWAEHTCALLQTGRRNGTDHAERVLGSPFGIRRCIEDLTYIYAGKASP